jgi:phage terminase small subunit
MEVMSMAELTEKQKRFADYYIESGNAEEAAKKAGYNARGNTTKLLQNTTIRAYIDKLIASKDRERIASQDEVLEFLTKVMRGQVIEKIPILAGEGMQVLVENTPMIRDREKAAELLGKRYMLWTDRQQIEGNLGVTIVDDIK